MATGKKVKLSGGSRDGKQFMIAQVVAEIGFPIPRQGENLHFDKEVYKHVAGSTMSDEPESYQFDRVDKMPANSFKSSDPSTIPVPNYPQWFADAYKSVDETMMIKDRIRLWLSSVWDRAEKAVDAGIPVSFCDEAGIVAVDVNGVKRYTPNGSTRITFEIGPFVTELPMRKDKQPEGPSELEPIIVPSRRAPVSEEYLQSMGFVYHDGKGGNPKRFWQRGSVLIASERDGYRAYVTPDPECNSHPNAAAARVVARRDVEMLVQLFGE